MPKFNPYVFEDSIQGMNKAMKQINDSVNFPFHWSLPTFMKTVSLLLVGHIKNNVQLLVHTQGSNTFHKLHLKLELIIFVVFEHR